MERDSDAMFLGAVLRRARIAAGISSQDELVPCRATFASAVSPIATGSARLSQRPGTRATRIIACTYPPGKGDKYTR